MDAQVRVKVLVLEGDPRHAEELRAFCEAQRLVALTVQPENLVQVLRSAIDLGALFLAEDYASHGRTGVALAQELHRIRPELPILLRRTPDALPLSSAQLRVLRHHYAPGDMDSLAMAVRESLFSLIYPEALVRGIAELTQSALMGQFRDISVSLESPCIVRDRLIFGEVYSLIPLEASWCRGYMMLQMESAGLQRLLAHQLGEVEDFHRDSIRAINNVFAETTNLVWGAFKNRFIRYDEGTAAKCTQVPIVINHTQRYISFGSEDPQLCFRYQLFDNAFEQGEPIVLHQRFVFNLNWSPELFRENEASVESMVASGELELF
ncbi:MAG: chemotaxis protein CheX [Burkholderiales bacterium]|uniref:chemotaxis protein CheX n=1 Tax=Inhella sp. TaxID=1921806 RepID=UPI001AD2D704|nr:chemotaxis protein CheX [Burkholderiales bacterium]